MPCKTSWGILSYPYYRRIAEQGSSCLGMSVECTQASEEFGIKRIRFTHQAVPAIAGRSRLRIGFPSFLTIICSDRPIPSSLITDQSSRAVCRERHR